MSQERVNEEINKWGDKTQNLLGRRIPGNLCGDSALEEVALTPHSSRVGRSQRRPSWEDGVHRGQQ